MSLSAQLFHDLVSRVSQSHQFSKILQIQQQKYQVQPFKIQGIDCQRILQIFQSISNRYQITGELTPDPQNWNENQRRVFTWFIIFYTYFLQKDHQELKQTLWPTLSTIFFNKQPQFLKFQFLNMIKPQNKITWTTQEDQLLTKAVQKEQTGKWNQIAKNIFFHSNYKIFKSSKHCRERWLNHLDTNKKKGAWTPAEDLTILTYVAENGKRWCKMVPLLKNSRTEHMIKNRFNSIVSKYRVSRKEREEYLVVKIIKQLKKQMLNAEIRRKAKEQKMKLIPQKIKEEIQSPQKATQELPILEKQTSVPIKLEETQHRPLKEDQKSCSTVHNSPDYYLNATFAQLNSTYCSLNYPQAGLSFLPYQSILPLSCIYWT